MFEGRQNIARLVKHLTNIVEEGKASWEEVNEAHATLKRQGRFDPIDPIVAAGAFELDVAFRRLELLEGPIVAGAFELDVESRRLQRPDGSIVSGFRHKPTMVLAVLMLYQPKVLSRQHIMRFSDIDLNRKPQIVDVYVKELRGQIETEDTPRHIITVTGKGYRFEP